jgi:N-acetylneuraminate synthase
LQCTSQYPCEPESIDVLNIEKLKKELICPTGLSDHSGTIYPSVAAMSLGADLVEVHMTFDKKAFGPDSKASLTLAELTELVRVRDYLHRLLTKFDTQHDKQQLKSLFGKSFYASKDIEPGEKFSWENVKLLKPVMGVASDDYKSLIGFYSNQNIKAGEPVYSTDIKDEKA